MKQTGLIYKPSPSDYVAGFNSPLKATELNMTGNWEDYLPTGEPQRIDFDTLSCATFSATNTVEIILKYFLENGYFSNWQISELQRLKLLKNGEFNLSDKFSAIMSGTTKAGNTLQAVWNSFRHDGILAEEYLPFSGKNWEEYHDKKQITSKLKALAKESLKILQFSYEWEMLPEVDTKNKLKQSPLNAGVPKVAQHGVVIYKPDWYFDSYEPYKKQYTGVQFALRGIVEIKKLVIKFGDRGDQVKELQELLGITADGVFGNDTLRAVKEFQSKNGLVADGIVGDKTMEKLKQNYRYFNPKSDPKMVGVKHELMVIVDEIRHRCGFPITITSGLRTNEENARLENASNESAHLKGLAVDLACNTSRQRFGIIKNALDLGINRIGIGRTFIHLDIDNTKDKDVIWDY